jgi:molybdate transport system substrate-binding protein
VRFECRAIANGVIMKRHSFAAATLMLGLALEISPMTDLQAAELRILAGGSLIGPLNELAPQFEKMSGHTLVIHFDSTPNLIKQATSGAPFDAAVVPVDVFKDAAAKARFGRTIDIARAGYGVIVRSGAPRPDVGTPEALKKTLLDAPSIAFVPESAAGAYVLKVFDRLGIAEAMKARTIAQTMPAQIAPAVARGEAALGVFLMNVLIAPGVDLAGAFPAELQQELVFSAAVAADGKQAEAAAAFVRFLTTPAAAAVIKAKGMTPAKTP